MALKTIIEWACAAVSNEKTLKKALPTESSIFTAEICAIDLALSIIEKDEHRKFLIFSDSLSVLTSLNNKKLENPLIIKLTNRIDSLSEHKEIFICWIPSHIGIRGNERADLAAKSALNLKPDTINIPYTDFKPKINQLIHAKWQRQWNNNTNNKLYQIKPILEKWRQTPPKSRKEQVVITRIHIGHTKLTHSFILKQEQQPQCPFCQKTCTIKHLFVECRALDKDRKQYLKHNSMKKLFENNCLEEILSFLRVTRIFTKI